MSKFSHFCLLFLPLCQGCCCQSYDYQNIPEGPRMKGIVATRNAPSAKRSSEGLRIKGLPSPTDDQDETQ
jgi:hypothetical protein